MKTKIEIVTRAFSELRINGITVDADSEDNELALSELEDIMYELQLDLGFNFEDTPNPNSASGLPNFAANPIAMLLAIRLAPSYGKLADSYALRASSAMSGVFARVKRPQAVPYPTRQPMGSGNSMRYPSFQFFPPDLSAPNVIDTKSISLGDSISLSFDFAHYLRDGETIQSYTATPTTGISISSPSYVDSVISMTVTALAETQQTITFRVTGTLGTVVNRIMYFNVVTGQGIGGQQ